MTEQSTENDALPWALWPWQRCKSRHAEGRCDLRREHGEEHAAERGMVTWRWRYPEEDLRPTQVNPPGQGEA